ncbi:MAG: 2,3-bisphosphoglycerate-independent phosphoglycerate mutase, partial [Alphaproteobacteria bacterium HGW-Alphaproteobacteria-11]
MTGARPLVLALLDGWGVRAEREANAIALARTPIYDRLAATAPRALLSASGEAIGIAPG